MKRILVMGLPGSGKTTFAQELQKQLEKNEYTVAWFNADEIRKKFDDWDFSEEGRLRQSERMRTLADAYDTDYVICDFVAPLVEQREIFEPDYIIWMDSIAEGRFNDTNQIFVRPENFNLRIDEFDAEYWAKFFVDVVL